MVQSMIQEERIEGFRSKRVHFRGTSWIDEIKVYALSFTIYLPDDSESTVQVSKKSLFLIPVFIKAAFKEHRWFRVTYAGLDIDEEKTVAEQSVNVIHTKSGERIIF